MPLKEFQNCMFGWKLTCYLIFFLFDTHVQLFQIFPSASTRAREVPWRCKVSILKTSTGTGWVSWYTCVSFTRRDEAWLNASQHLYMFTRFTLTITMPENSLKHHQINHLIYVRLLQRFLECSHSPADNKFLVAFVPCLGNLSKVLSSLLMWKICESHAGKWFIYWSKVCWFSLDHPVSWLVLWK